MAVHLERDQWGVQAEEHARYRTVEKVMPEVDINQGVITLEEIKRSIGEPKGRKRQVQTGSQQNCSNGWRI